LHELQVILSKTMRNIAFARPIYKMDKHGYCENCKFPVINPKSIQENRNFDLCECKNCHGLLKIPKSEA